MAASSPVPIRQTSLDDAVLLFVRCPNYGALKDWVQENRCFPLYGLVRFSSFARCCAAYQPPTRGFKRSLTALYGCFFFFLFSLCDRTVQDPWVVVPSGARLVAVDDPRRGLMQPFAVYSSQQCADAHASPLFRLCLHAEDIDEWSLQQWHQQRCFDYTVAKLMRIRGTQIILLIESTFTTSQTHG
jgi:hypothetical protein